MKVCVISFVECWRNQAGAWHASGGFPRQMEAIASLFDEMDLVAVAGEPKPGGHPLPDKARVIALRKPYGVDGRRKLSLIGNLPYYAGAMLPRMLKADAVHVPLPGDLPLLGMALAILFRRRVLARYGGSWYSNTQTTPMNRVTRAAMRWFAGGSNIMLATGSGASEPAPGMEWIFSTAVSEDELAEIRPNFRRGLSSPPQLVYCGRLSVEKGVGTLLEALGVLRREGFAAMPRLTIMGDGPDRSSLQEAARRLDISDHVVFAGQLDRNGLSEVLLRADVCVQPSLSEGFSKAWIDAMAHGVPVVASRVGAAAEVIGEQNERGWLVRPHDIEQLATTLGEVLTQEQDWEALRRRCRAYAETLTLESWQREIGKICSRRWNWTFAEGRLAG